MAFLMLREGCTSFPLSSRSREGRANVVWKWAGHFGAPLCIFPSFDMEQAAGRGAGALWAGSASSAALPSATQHGSTAGAQAANGALLLGLAAGSERALALPTAAEITDGGAALSRRRADGSIENVMDEMMLQYLKRRGYRVEPASQPGHSGDEERRRLLGSGETTTLESYAQTLGLDTEACAANHVLFYGLAGGDPEAYDEAYGRLLDWICNSLDLYKYELHAVAFPLFAHCFLELMAKGFAEHATRFFHKFAADHKRLHLEELRALGMIFSPQHLRESEYATLVLHSKFSVELSLLSFELLHSFLSQARLFLLLTILNERVNLVVDAANHSPGIPVHQLDDEPEETRPVDPMNNLEPTNEHSSGYTSPDEVAQVVAVSEHPNESEIASVLMPDNGKYDGEHLIRAATSGQGMAAKSSDRSARSMLENLNSLPIQWGVLPERKVHVPEAEDGAGGAAGAESKDDAGNSGTANGAAGAGANAGSSDPAASGGTAGGEGDKKSASSGDAASKSGDKKSSSATADKSAGATGASDAQRKHKRAKAGSVADAAALSEKKGPLEETGPLPDRKSTFNAEIMEKLVLRMPQEMKAHVLEDLRVRAALDKSNLPSALCFTLLNSAVHINNMCFSDDVTLVGASCDDSSFRVWRNDDQPLGTATGGSFHHQHGAESSTDIDEKTAVLRGHSGAVYGADFSPDDRFALTASADSTVRLWSLASKSNVVTYRGHTGGFPVWDVNFAPLLGYYFATCSMDRTARLWSTDRVTPLRVYAGHLSDVDCVRFHPNNNYLATGSSDKTVRLWDVQSGTCVRVFTGHFHGVRSLAFSSNGRYLASAGDDQYINIWDLHAGKRLETLIGHKAMVTSLDFSRESSVLASGGMDSTVRLWDMKTLTEQPTPTHAAGGASLSGAMANMHVTSSSSAVPAPKRPRFVHPVQMARADAVPDLAPSRFLLKTLRSKHTPIYRVQFTPRNLLLAGGVFSPKTDA